MDVIQTIDLWTEQIDNHTDCFNGAFVDGFEEENIPFDQVKIIKNCNCIITINRKDLPIRNKHQAIVFYRDQVPVRLMVINKNTDVEKCIEIALSQPFGSSTPGKYYQELGIHFTVIDRQEEAIYNDFYSREEIDVGSCDRWSLLYNMLKESYTESDTNYGHFEPDQYEFLPDIEMKYTLETDTERFEIEHTCAFVNVGKTRLIPIQENSPLTKKLVK